MLHCFFLEALFCVLEGAPFQTKAAEGLFTCFELIPLFSKAASIAFDREAGVPFFALPTSFGLLKVWFQFSKAKLTRFLLSVLFNGPKADWFCS